MRFAAICPFSHLSRVVKRIFSVRYVSVIILNATNLNILISAFCERFCHLTWKKLIKSLKEENLVEFVLKKGRFLIVSARALFSFSSYNQV